MTKGGIQFVGNYIYPCVMTNTNGTDYYILNDVFKSSTSRTKIKGFRAYFHVPSSLGVKGLCFGEDDTTGILEISDYMFTSPVNIYSVGGQLLRKNATNMDDLPKGTYIVNGKKIFKSK